MAGMNWQRLSVLACAVALSPVTELLAQDAPSAGIVRISDRGGVKNVAHKMGGEYNAPPAAMMGQGYGSYSGDCPTCYGNDKHKSGSFKERYCSHSPDHGFSIPGKWPIHRRGVQYQHFYPSAWAGTETAAAADVPRYPMAYMPTDTTQLGFYHQHVPFWQPQPNPMPRRPIPAQWHMYAPVVSASAWGDGYTKGASLYDQNCPIDSTTVIQQGSPTPVQQPASPQPPVDAPRPLPPAPDSGM